MYKRVAVPVADGVWVLLRPLGCKRVMVVVVRTESRQNMVELGGGDDCLCGFLITLPLYFTIFRWVSSVKVGMIM